MVKKYSKLVSIIIRGKNESRWLKILLQELKKQSIQNYEIVFCDNDSEDNSIDILKKHKVKKILKFKEYKPGYVLNEAIKKSDGKYISILSAHCIPENKFWLEEHVSEIEKSNEIAAVYGKQIPMPGSSIQNLIDLDIIFKNQPIIYKKDPYLNNANSIYKSEILKQNLFDDKLSNIEDRVWANNITFKKYSISYSAKSPVFHLHGIHHHKSETDRAKTTYNILKKKYDKIWRNCAFLKNNYFNFSFIINARRLKDKKTLLLKIKQILKKEKKININFSNIFVISNFKLRMKNKNIKFIKASRSLKSDLKSIYKDYYKIWIDVNFCVYVNIQANINFKNLENIIVKNVYYNYESLTLAEKITENFIISRDGIDEFESTSLVSIEKKPIVTLLKWSKGCIIDPDYLRRGTLFTKKTKLNYI